MRLSRPCVPLVALLLACVVAAAAEPTAGEWLADCQAYLAAIDGEDASDLDITYCTGQTIGIMAGLGTGARIGAVSMASSLTVLAGLDQDEVLAVFRSMQQSDLLQICAPPEVPTAELIETVAGHLARQSRPRCVAGHRGILRGTAGALSLSGHSGAGLRRPMIQYMRNAQ
jgi:hypothetical protein